MQWNWLNICSLINFLTSLTLGLFVYSKNRKIAVNRIFGLMSLFVALWAGTFFIYVSVSDRSSSVFWVRVCNIFAFFIPITYLHFVLELLGEVKQKRVLLKIGYGINIVVVIFVLISPQDFLGNVRFKIPYLSNVFYADQPRILFHIFTFIFFLYVNYAVVCMLRAYKGLRGISRNQIKYLLIATLIGFGGGGSTFLLVYDIPFPPYPNILMSFYTIVLAIAIIRYRLMDIETVIHRTLLWMLTSSLILIPISVLLYFTRPWLVQLNWIQLTLVTTALFYLYLYYYHKMQPKIDHLFRRRKYDYQTILGKVAEKIATTISIEDLTQQLLTEVCETMYLRNSLLYVLSKDEKKYSLLGRRGYKEVEGLRQRTALEIYTDEEKAQLSIIQRELQHDSPLCKWLITHQDVLEKELIEVDPQYEGIRQEALAWFKEHDIEVVVPLVVKDKVNALLGLGKKENLQAYNVKDLQLLKKLGQEAGVTVFNALHYEDLAEKERLDQEMKMGRQIQMTLLPQFIPQIPGLTVRGLMGPAKEIGGDYYDFITLPQKNQIGVVIGDVSGKGVAAGLIMSLTKATIHNLSEEGFSPKEILLRTNRFLNRHVGGQKFMTLLYLLWQSNDQTLTYSSAGHEHILIWRHPTQELETIQSGGFMLGMIPNIDTFLEEKQIKLGPKDKILLYTDGVTEAENASGDRFGLRLLRDAFKKHSQKPAAALIQAIKDEVYVFIGSHPQYDDITLVVLEAE